MPKDRPFAAMRSLNQVVSEADRLDHLRRCWDQAFPACELVEIPRPYGGYFLPETVGGLAEAILRPAA